MQLLLWQPYNFFFIAIPLVTTLQLFLFCFFLAFLFFLFSFFSIFLDFFFLWRTTLIYKAYYKVQLLVWTQSPPQALPNAPHYTISQSFDRPDGRFCGSFDNSNTTFPIFSKIFNFLIKLLFSRTLATTVPITEINYVDKFFDNYTSFAWKQFGFLNAIQSITLSLDSGFNYVVTDVAEMLKIVSRYYKEDVVHQRIPASMPDCMVYVLAARTLNMPAEYRPRAPRCLDALRITFEGFLTASKLSRDKKKF